MEQITKVEGPGLVEALLSERFRKRFWAKVRKGEACWEWTGGKTYDGYGRICLVGDRVRRNLLAHRASWIIAHGPIPSGLQVCHRCDVRTCVNPEHLYLGTNWENAMDCIGKGRAKRARGERSGRAKLNADQVRAIRSGRKRGRALLDLAEEYGVNEKTIYDICRRKNWRHV